MDDVGHSPLCCPVSFSNNVNVEGATHKQVVELIKSGGDVLSLTVISVSPEVSILCVQGLYFKNLYPSVVEKLEQLWRT